MQPRDEHRPFTEADKLECFKIATTSLVHWYGDRFVHGMTDEELAAALETALGILGGSGGPNTPSVTFTGAGLRIWGGWHVVNHREERPLFAGKATVALARQVYGIADPTKKQLEMF